MATTPIYTGGMPDNGTLARAVAELQAAPAASLTASQVDQLKALVTPVGWANRPNAVNNSQRVIYVIDIGASGAFFKSDSAYFKPLNSIVTIQEKTGSVSTPLATLGTGITSGVFTIPVDAIVVGGLMMPDGTSSVNISFTMRHVGSATSTALVYFGTTGTSADSVVLTAPIAATNSLDCVFNAKVSAISSHLCLALSRHFVPVPLCRSSSAL